MTVKALWQQRDNKLLVLLGSAPVLYMLYFYGGNGDVLAALLRNSPPDLLRVGFSRVVAFVTLGLLPVFIIRFTFHNRLANFGLVLCEGKYNLFFILIGVPVVLLMTWLSAHAVDFRLIYPEVRSAINTPHILLWSSLFYLLYYVGYEVFFRGYLLFGIEQRLGSWPAILITTLATTLVHINRPAGEYAAALVAGFVFGYVALRTRSLWGVFVLHAVAGLSLDLFCAFP